MDKKKAQELEKKIKGKIINGYEVIEFLNNGKSAAVFRAKKDDIYYAIKVFDNDIVEKFGHEIQTKRIEQEIALKNHSIKNLINIHEGGNEKINDQIYYYIIMDFIEGVNLKDFIQNEEYDEIFIKKVLSILYQITEELLKNKNIVHRDIKPENIMVDKNQNIILMDLGVLKLVGAKSFSDIEEKQFLGTLRYAPPEFLSRQEVDTPEGWEAINMYQIGAVIHDLIMKQELFIDKTPYPNLVIAINYDAISVSNNKYSYNLLQLTRDMLIKDWKKRLQICTEERIYMVINEKDKVPNDTLEKILKMRIDKQAKFDLIEQLQRDKQEIKKKQQEFADKLSTCLDKIFNSIQQKSVFHSFNKYINFSLDNDNKFESELIRNYIYEIGGNLKMGFSQPFFIFIRTSNDENNYSEINLLGIIPARNLVDILRQSPSLFFQSFTYQKRDVTYYNIFKGNVEFENKFEDNIENRILTLIFKFLKIVEPEVNNKLEMSEKEVRTGKGVVIRESISPDTILIDKE
jgi:serine/threonine protein kinase